MTHIKKRHMIVAIFLILVLLSSADGKPRPTISDITDCLHDPTTDFHCDGQICYCCYDDGCWICNNPDVNPNPDCAWDQGPIPPWKPWVPIPISINPGTGQNPTTLPNPTLLRTRLLNNITEIEQNPTTPPSIPSIPSGPTVGRPFASYAYSTSATDPNGDKVKYTLDWGDGTSPSTCFWINSGAKATLSHKWDRTGTYLVKAMTTSAKGAKSSWSSALSVTISPAYVQISKIGNAPEVGQGSGRNNSQNNKINRKIPIRSSDIKTGLQT
jgi:hypothetical protein